MEAIIMRLDSSIIHGPEEYNSIQVAYYWVFHCYAVFDYSFFDYAVLKYANRLHYVITVLRLKYYALAAIPDYITLPDHSFTDYSSTDLPSPTICHYPIIRLFIIRLFIIRYSLTQLAINWMNICSYNIFINHSSDCIYWLINHHCHIDKWIWPITSLHLRLIISNNNLIRGHYLPHLGLIVSSSDVTFEVA